MNARTGELTALYGHRVVAVDAHREFIRDVTLVTVEIPNELLERVLRPGQTVFDLERVPE